MRAFLLAFLALAPATVFAQNLTFLQGLVSTLQSAGLTRTIQVALSLNGTASGLQLLSNVSNGQPHLIFAPTDNAWTNAPSNVSSDQGILTDVFAYHIVQGNFSGVSTVYPNTTVGQTLYNNPATVRLEGGKAQVVAWAIREDNLTHVLNQRNDTTVLNATIYENLTIAIVDHVLNVPETLTDTVPTINASLFGFEQYLRATTLGFFNETTNQTADISFFDAFDQGYRGFTLFAPNTSAVEQFNSTLQNLLANDRTAINAVMWNHLINATTLYSPLLTGSQNYTSQGGETFSFSINATGQFVTQGNITARIIQPDVLLPNGVVHIIDNVFLTTDTDSNAASSALSSAVSAATQPTVTAAPSGPIGFSLTQSLGGTSSSPSGSISAVQSASSTNGAASTTAPPSTSTSAPAG